MNEIVYKDSLRTLTETLRAELKNQAESFVKVGYLLKAARDTGVLEESSYSGVNDFASAEYGLTPDMVSRYIRIYERFGDRDGVLKAEYQGYGVAKLQIMITLPDEINEELTPDMTKNQITEVAAEVHEEQKVSDMEVMCEDKDEEHTIIQAFFLDYWKEHQTEYSLMERVLDREPGSPEESKEFYDILYPSGTGAIFARVPGKGKYMISGLNPTVPAVLVNIRTNEKTDISWIDIIGELTDLNISFTPEAWHERYEGVAPVQEAAEDPVTSPAKAEPQKKTPEQEYDEKQAKIDRDAKKKLQERQDAEKMAAGPQYQTHEIRLAKVFWDDVESGRKRFELRKNDRGYKVGDTLLMQEFDGGKFTGRTLSAKIIYMLEDYTGLTEGYAILGTELIKEDNNELPGQMKIENA